MIERFELMEKALITMLEEKKYAALRDLLRILWILRRLSLSCRIRKSPYCFVCCLRSWRRRPLWKWSRRSRNL